MKLFDSPQTRSRTAIRRSGFTLVEVLVAVAIMSLLFAVILVPLRLGFETFHIGTARSEVQQQAQLTMQQIGIDLRKAQFVFPNSRIVGVSDNTDETSPCSSRAYRNANGWNFNPYVISDASGSVTSWENSSRIDMLQLRGNTDDGLPQDVGADYVVSYYPRRLDMDRAYDLIDNPIVLFRAQYPYRSYSNTTGGFTLLPANANIDWTAYPAAPSGVTGNNNFRWIKHNAYGEADELAVISVDSTTGSTPTVGAHTLATPRGMALVAPRANLFTTSPTAASEKSLVPELSFVQEATSGKRIDRVTVNMTLAQFDQGGAGAANGQGAAQRVRVSQTFDLPSAGCSP